MSNSVTLITGALTGIGRATALAFAQPGARLVVSGRNNEAGKQLEAALRELGADAVFVRADVQNEDDVRAVVQATVERFGRLDTLVNNAGVEGELGPVVNQTVQNFHSVFDTNVLGTLLTMKHTMPVMAKQGSGSIVNLSSVGGHVGFANAATYVASKHAVEGLTKSAALEGAAIGVRVNAVAPGPVDTEMLNRFVGNDPAVKADFVSMIPAKRPATPEEIAQTIAFLASDKVPYLTGQVITVDGAYTAQ